MKSKGGFIGISLQDKGKVVEDHYPPLVYGATLLVSEGAVVEEGQEIARWDPFTTPMIVEISGESMIALRDVVEGITMREEVDEVTGLTTKVIIDSADEQYQPRHEATRQSRQRAGAGRLATDARRRRPRRATPEPPRPA